MSEIRNGHQFEKWRATWKLPRFFLIYLLDSERGILISGLRRNPLPDRVRGAAEEIPVQDKRDCDKTRPFTDPIKDSVQFVMLSQDLPNIVVICIIVYEFFSKPLHPTY